ncbi:hypothetical protein BH11PLA2_BH11PLA2_29850 [soil metagenome]
MTLKENHPRRQHCVPRFLLKQFGDKDERFFVFNKATGVSFESEAVAVIAQTHFYDFVDSTGEQQTYEYVLAYHEGVISQLFRTIIERESVAHLTGQDRLNIGQFIAVLQYRTQAVRHRLKSLYQGIQRTLEERGIDGGDVVPKFTAENLQKASLQHMHQSIKNGRIFSRRLLMLQRAPDSTPFYISDNPVAMVNPLEPHIRRMPEHRGTEVYMPISRQFSLHIASDFAARVLFGDLTREARIRAVSALSSKAHLLASEDAENQNMFQVEHSSRFIISAIDDFKLVMEMIQRNPKLKEPPGYTVS